MKGDEARELLGFPPDSRPSISQVKAAYKKKVWDSHPDWFPEHAKSHAESKFKMIWKLWHLSGVRKKIDDVWFRGAKKFADFVKSVRDSGNPTAFAQMQEAYSCMMAGGRADQFSEATHVRVVRKGVYGAHKRGSSTLIKAPFLLIILGTLSLGGFNAHRAYQRQKEDFPVSNPFLP